MKPRTYASRSLVVVFLKAIAVVAMIGTPLAGVWVASSLAAFANHATAVPLVAGLLLFPGLPLAWEGIGVLRARRRKLPKKRFLTFGDRLVLRTLAINALFLGVLLAAFPTRAFVALSARGDWMLDGRHGPVAERMRGALVAAAGTVEWLYEATRDKPYRDDTTKKDDGQRPVPPPPVPPVPPTTPTTEKRDAYPLPASIHPVVAAMPAEAETSIADVARYIAAREPNARMRVKALHDYVADRVAYDAASYAAGRIPYEDGDAKAVFRSRVGVCAGYAHLLVELGKVTGDEIVYVVGDARSQHSPMEGEGHAWNAAKVDGAWVLLDPTWDAGYVEGGKFVKRYATQYLFTPPEQFVVGHFPDAPKWQLLAAPIGRAEFFRRPVLAPSFFAHGLTLTTPDRSQVSTGATLALGFENPNHAWLMADFVPKHGGSRTDCKGDRHTQMQCAFPAAGTYDVRLYVNDTQFGTYAYAGAVEVNARP